MYTVGEVLLRMIRLDQSVRVDDERKSSLAGNVERFVVSAAAKASTFDFQLSCSRRCGCFNGPSA